ncbi:hypothetical protein CRG98_036558 [Punica granatum]|uniref:Uncharacterized protein n=1 Tax=Punica granatum TaxID=22663 RepID=A0A2I0IGG5_PUNGR|nr:hypothetical protein CRG98_036558 [Punica granatum]
MYVLVVQLHRDVYGDTSALYGYGYGQRWTGWGWGGHRLFPVPSHRPADLPLLPCHQISPVPHTSTASTLPPQPSRTNLSRRLSSLKPPKVIILLLPAHYLPTFVRDGGARILIC